MRKSTWKKIKKERLEAQLTKHIASIPGELRRVAFHEASHAVVGELFSFSTEYVTVVPEYRGGSGVSGGHCKFKQYDSQPSFRRLCFLIAETASVPAEEMIVGYVEPSRVAKDIEFLTDDDIGESILPLFVGIARHIVSRKDVWTAITELAEALLQRKTIDGNGIREIVLKHVSADVIVTETAQIEANQLLEQEGPTAFGAWFNKRFEMQIVSYPSRDLVPVAA
jgi:hypothetical protein